MRSNWTSFILSFGTEIENLIRVVLIYPLYSVLGEERKKTVLFKMVSEILYWSSAPQKITSLPRVGYHWITMYNVKWILFRGCSIMLGNLLQFLFFCRWHKVVLHLRRMSNHNGFHKRLEIDRAIIITA